MTAIRYADGVEAKVGDQVDYDGVPSTVECVIDSAEEIAKWGVNEAGLMFKNDIFGLVFESCDSVAWDSIVFIARETESGE